MEGKDEEYPAIREAARSAGARVFFCDEAAIRTDYSSGTTWAPAGQTPIVRGTGYKRSVHMISAVSPQGKMHFSFLPGSLNSATFVEYLKNLLHDIPGPVFLIADNYPSHKSRETLEFVKSTEGRLSIYFLPPYSPELNPDEWVWKNVKHDNVGKMAFRSQDEMRIGVERALKKLQSATEFVRSFFRAPDLSYILPTVQ